MDNSCFYTVGDTNDLSVHQIAYFLCVRTLIVEPQLIVVYMIIINSFTHL